MEISMNTAFWSVPNTLTHYNLKTVALHFTGRSGWAVTELRAYLIFHHKWLTFAGISVRRGWVGRDERQKRQRKRLRDEKLMDISEPQGRREEATSLGVGMELTKHLENHHFNRKTMRRLPLTSWHLWGDDDVTCHCKDIIKGYSTLQSLWCVLKIELLITVQYKSWMTNASIISVSLVDSSSLASPRKIPYSYQTERWWNTCCMSCTGRNTCQTLLFGSR